MWSPTTARLLGLGTAALTTLLASRKSRTTARAGADTNRTTARDSARANRSATTAPTSRVGRTPTIPRKRDVMAVQPTITATKNRIMPPAPAGTAKSLTSRRIRTSPGAMSPTIARPARGKDRTSTRTLITQVALVGAKIHITLRLETVTTQKAMTTRTTRQNDFSSACETKFSSYILFFSLNIFGILSGNSLFQQGDGASTRLRRVQPI